MGQGEGVNMKQTQNCKNVAQFSSWGPSCHSMEFCVGGGWSRVEPFNRRCIMKAYFTYACLAWKFMASIWVKDEIKRVEKKLSGKCESGRRCTSTFFFISTPLNSWIEFQIERNKIEIKFWSQFKSLNESKFEQKLHPSDENSSE